MKSKKKILYAFFLPIMATNKCNLIRGKGKEARECTEKLSELWGHILMKIYSWIRFFLQCQMHYYI